LESEDWSGRRLPVFGAPAAGGDGRGWDHRRRRATGHCWRRREEAFPVRCLRRASSRGWSWSAAAAWAARWRITAAVRRRRLRRRTREEPAVGAAHRGSVGDSFGGTVAAADAGVVVVAHAGGRGGREAWHAAVAAAAAAGGRRKGGDVVGGGGDDGEHPGGPADGPAAQVSG
jgi:hypothetical protein